MQQFDLQIPTISAALAWADAQQIEKLDAEILLAHTLQVTRSHLHAWPDRKLDAAEQNIFLQYISRRLQSEPIAYITGHREFWSLDFVVTPDVLIPRPETELLVELVLKEFTTDEPKMIADLGTGSGAIALSLAHEKPDWNIYATESNIAALEVAIDNAKRLDILNVNFTMGHWCNALPNLHFDAIISNPPYIEAGDSELNQDVIKFEPHQALFSGELGLQDISEIINSSKNYLKSRGCLLIEHGYRQAKAVKGFFAQAGFTEITLYKDMAGLDRVTTGRFS
jgi:release factor glutamine methyltransferase